MVKSRLKLVLAEHNVQRLKAGLKPITTRQLATETGLGYTTIIGLTANRHEAVHFRTIDLLCKYFDCEPGDLFTRTPVELLEETEVQT